ncbi:YdjY domain-containing protein [Verrucomicrobia bacterium]|nr:YdjY domain-containing protein [Verrucomicrobiota bacterium]MDC0219757.1 YdjY domain-containing protein [Verrucomicrobiota bacterium]
MKRFCLPLILSSALVSIHAQDDPFKPEPLPQPVIKEITPDILQVGTVKLVKKAKEVHIPVTIEMHEGPIEYLVVTGRGKVHESLFVTTAEPHHVQVAMLLLNAKGSVGKLISDDAKTPIPGQPVDIELHWEEDGKGKKERIERFVQTIHPKLQPAKKGPFIFNGSRVFEGQFLAQRDGSIISLITDNAAQFNNPRPGRDDDELWRPQPKGLPAIDSKATVVIRLLKFSAQKNKEPQTSKFEEVEKRNAKGARVGLLEKGLWYKRGGSGSYTGRVVGYYKNKQLESERFYENGIQVGVETHWYDSGVKRWELIYKNGKLISQRSWDPDGNESK